MSRVGSRDRHADGDLKNFKVLIVAIVGAKYSSIFDGPQNYY